MLKVLRHVFEVITIIIIVHGLITKNFDFQSIMILFLGLMMLVMGLEEFRKNKPMVGWLFIVISLFSLLISILGLILTRWWF